MQADLCAASGSLSVELEDYLAMVKSSYGFSALRTELVRRLDKAVTIKSSINTAALAILLISCVNISAGSRPMRIVKYQQNEFRYDPVEREAVLSTFVYDIPYFGACGIFPPWHVMNQIFSKGGGDGGMSPGATWAPFEISEIEYQELVSEIRELNPKHLGHKARYTWVKFEFDTSFDSIQDGFTWRRSVCEKHRAEYHLKLAKAAERGT